MRRVEFRTVIWSALLAFVLSATAVVAPTHAQEVGGAGYQQGMEQQDDGMDWGWIGLLGLAGLLGLRRRDHNRVDTTTRTTRP